MSHFPELFGNATSPVATAMTLEDDSYQRGQLSILFFKDCWLSSLPGIKRISVDTEITTNLGDVSLTSLAIGEATYEDCNDHNDLRHDPVFKIVAGRSVNEDALASQPTLSRSEISLTPKMLKRLRTLLVTTGIEQLRQKNNGQLPDSVTLDIDPTDVATRGQQQLTMLHGYSVSR